jgi:hypothetical protein
MGREANQSAGVNKTLPTECHDVSELGSTADEVLNIAWQRSFPTPGETKDSSYISFSSR